MDQYEVNLANRALSGDMQALKEFVTAKDHLQYTNLPENIIALHVTHEHLRSKIVDIRLDLHMTIEEVKEKLYRHVGTSSTHMELYLRSHGQVIAHLDEDKRKLGFYSPVSGMELFIRDLDPFSLAKSGWLENVDLVQKYMISEEDYDKRQKTVRSYKREMIAKDANWKPPVLPGSSAPAETRSTGPESVEGIPIGSRCEVQPGGRRGTVGYVGEVPEIQGGGFWVGIRFDEPLGKGDGCAKGKRYFDCPPKFGSFVRGWNVTVGDFPEVDPFADDDDDEEL